MQTVEINNIFQNQNRNVLDKFKCWTNDSIRENIQSSTINAAVAMFHLNGDFNISTLLRNTNFFGFKECLYIGKRQWDRRGAVGVQNYTRLSYCKDENEFWDYIQESNYCPIAIENNVDFKIENLYSFNIPPNPIFIFGEECSGLSAKTLVRCRHILSIPDFGSVRSLNVGTASGIIMSEYRRQLYSKK